MHHRMLYTVLVRVVEDFQPYIPDFVFSYTTYIALNLQQIISIHSYALRILNVQSHALNLISLKKASRFS